jgi:predicted ATP-dependent endonuclease of OLD family
LKKIVNDKGLECEDKRKASQLRKSIRNQYQELVFSNIPLQIDLEGVKQIWTQLDRYLPVFALFQSDRPNRDQDSEIQDPMKFAIQQILKKDNLQEKLLEVATEVQTIAEEIANSTLEKLKEMNPEIADQLKPIMPKAETLKWESVFKGITIASDDIPMNKRGSGVRRLVLLNFFRAEAERRRAERDVPNIIYAIEEPETSQHPNHQIKLIEALVELSQSENTQVMITTHSPALAQLIPSENLRFIEREKNHVKFEDSDLLKIVNTLGVLPKYSKVVVCVEGEFDRKFLVNINQNIPELKEIFDLEEYETSIIPLHGGNLKFWVERQYLKDSNIIEFHLYDKDDDDKYAQQIQNINERDGLSCALQTSQREMENYIHWSLIDEQFGIALNNENWERRNIPNEISQKTGQDEKIIKNILNGSVAKKITKQHLEELGVYDEVKSWFLTMLELQKKSFKQ